MTPRSLQISLIRLVTGQTKRMSLADKQELKTWWYGDWSLADSYRPNSFEERFLQMFSPWQDWDGKHRAKFWSYRLFD